LDTTGLMQTALDMAGMKEVPPDSGIWNSGNNLERILFAVDAGSAELLYAKESGYDALVAHHPVGPARIGFPAVTKRHVEFMVEKGVPKSVAEEATRSLMERLEVRVHPANYMHEVDLAKALKLPFANIHLPIDQITRDILLEKVTSADGGTVGDLVEALGRLEEFSKAETGIRVMMGGEKNELGKWVLVFAAGTNGGYPVAKAYFEHGVDTVIYLHVDYEDLSRLKKDSKGNLIVLGHMAGDSIGINIFLRRLKEKGVSSDTLGVIR
jgi:putative NIF3 family GTP cyclohydrolase 1 type 2